MKNTKLLTTLILGNVITGQSAESADPIQVEDNVISNTIQQTSNYMNEWFESWETLANMGNTGVIVGMGITQERNGYNAKAMKRYKKAAELGDIYAMFRMGHIQERLGNIFEARNWYQKGEELGDVYAISGLERLNAKENAQNK